MIKDIGPQYKKDDFFKAAARLHQSKYRAWVLKADYSEYGNRLTDVDGRALMNYYDGLGVREVLRQRYPHYSKMRDADLLRSEHIPFNMLAPLVDRPELARMIISQAFGIELQRPYKVKLEWTPKPKEDYLNDMTSFDTYLQGTDINGELVGIGVEVKFTECGYAIGKTEAENVKDLDSAYWVITRESGIFSKDKINELIEDDLRQIWRNHLLGLAMIKHNDISKFVSLILYPSGNEHLKRALKRYQAHLKDTARNSVRGCTFEHYIDCLQGDSEIKKWKQYLIERYLI